MTWTIEFTPNAQKDLKRLLTRDNRRIVDFMEGRVASHPNPRQLAKRLAGQGDEIWRFRVGDYRILAEFHDAILTVAVIEIGHRGKVYR